MPVIDLDPISAFREMSFIRQFEERCLELSHEGVAAGSLHFCLGQEAIPVGAVSALDERDRVLATYRGHGWALACGVPPEELLGEICHRQGGINGGRGGSAYFTAPDYRFLGENSIVGAGVPIATGVALAAQSRQSGGVVVVSIGDGAMNQGSVHEAMAFASARDLPVVIVCENNGWAEMTPTPVTTRVESLAERARAYAIEAETVDGCDPFLVREAVATAVERARSGAGPSLVECRTVRLSGHYNRDIQHYRPQQDRDDAAQREPLGRLRTALIAEGVPAEELESVDAEVRELIETTTLRVREMPAADPSDVTAHVTAAPAVSEPDQDAAPAEPRKELTYQRAINAAMRIELETRPEVLVYGEDVGHAGGIFGVSRGLQKTFGAQRVFDTPISESAILGSAVGASMCGMRPIVEIMWGDFLWVAFDQLVNQASNVRYISRGQLSAPMVVRMQQGATPGSCAQHSQSLEAVLAHVPGLKVGVSATPADGYAMTRAAVADPDPCVLIESRELYQMNGEVTLGAPVESVGGARLHRQGGDLCIVTWGAMVHRALAAAETLSADGIDVAVLDLRWLNPIDHDALSHGVRANGGRVLVAHEANLTGGFGAEIASIITDRHFDELAAPVARVGAPDIRIPASPSLQAAVIPGHDALVEECRRLLTRTRSPQPVGTRG